MRSEARWALAAALALGIGVVAAEPYARLTAPFYRVAATSIGAAHHWAISQVIVEPRGSTPGTFLQLHGAVPAADGTGRVASLITRVQVGAVIEGSLIFWTLLFAWPAPPRRRIDRLLLGIPLFLGLEAATTVCQLLNGFAEASALLAGAQDPLTPWERWSRFIESGGRDVLAVCAALLAVAAESRLTPAAAARSPP